MIDKLYNKLVVERYNNPIGYGTLDNPHREIKALNRMCGDAFTIYLHLDEDSTIRLARFDGDGCALSITSTSLLVEHIEGLSIEEAKNLARLFLDRFEGKEVQLPELLDTFASVNHYRARKTCITLPWEALLNE